MLDSRWNPPLIDEPLKNVTRDFSNLDLLLLGPVLPTRHLTAGVVREALRLGNREVGAVGVRFGDLVLASAVGPVATDLLVLARLLFLEDHVATPPALLKVRLHLSGERLAVVIDRGPRRVGDRRRRRRRARAGARARLRRARGRA